MKLAAEGRSLDEVARIMGRTPESIRRVSIRLGVSLTSQDKTISAEKKTKPDPQ
jgi:hypothetical protein